MQPLHNIRILDLTRLLPGAVCTMLLRDLGADIIKIEDPIHGDYARRLPPMIDGMGAVFRSGNRGKRSLAIDLKSDAGQAILHRLAGDADVLIEGFRPGVAARLGADHETLISENSKLVTCSLSGWGQTGPYADLSGHDLNYIARTGLLGAELNPQTPATQVADIAGAYVGMMGILAALLKRERTGMGDHVDVALSEAALPFGMVAWIDSFFDDESMPRLNLRGESACYRVYQAADGEPVTLAAIEAKFWANFCQAVDRRDWIPQHAMPEKQPQLIAKVAALFKCKTAAEWAELLDAADCCFSTVTPPGHLLDDPQLKARGMLGISESSAPWMRSPIRLSDADIDLSDAPSHGEHSREVLLEAGYAPGEIDALIAAGVIRQAE